MCTRVLHSAEWSMMSTNTRAGPASYEINTQKPPKGGKFNLSKSKSDVDWIIYRSSQIPAPGQYDSENVVPKGGKISKANPKTPLDWQILLAKSLPGPGQYEQPNSTSRLSGGKFNTSKSKSNLEWVIYNAKQIPGPGSYSIESPSKFTQKNVSFSETCEENVGFSG